MLRCELDGSGLEVVHRGLRNPQELAFDAHGDLFTGDNNSDGGDRARLVQIVAGADSGWRIGFQWLDDRGAWNRERMWQPRQPGQPARTLPPITNFADGPSGLAFDPGVGLPERFRGCFLLCDFRGGASYSGVHAIRLQRAGAGYELASADKVVWNVLATDVDFGPDGAMYVLDWVAGWNKTGKGRIYRVRTPGMANDMQLRAGAQLLAADLKPRGEAALVALLAHADRRVRQEAQFALVDLGARDALLAAAKNKAGRQARLHGLFRLGILGRTDAAALDGVAALHDDGDAEVRAIAARVLGDCRRADAVGALTKRLSDGSGRVQREAALALARLGAAAEPATGELVELLRQNDDRDAVLRHAASYALAEAATPDGSGSRRIACGRAWRAAAKSLASAAVATRFMSVRPTTMSNFVVGSVPPRAVSSASSSALAPSTSLAKYLATPSRKRWSPRSSPLAATRSLHAAILASRAFHSAIGVLVSTSCSSSAIAVAHVQSPCAAAGAAGAANEQTRAKTRRPGVGVRGMVSGAHGGTTATGQARDRAGFSAVARAPRC